MIESDVRGTKHAEETAPWPSASRTTEQGGRAPCSVAGYRVTSCWSEAVLRAADRLRTGADQAVCAAYGPAPRVPGRHARVAGEGALCAHVRPEAGDEAADPPRGNAGGDGGRPGDHHAARGGRERSARSSV